MSNLPTTTQAWLLANKATDLPVLEGDNPTFKLETVDIPALKDNQILVKTLYLSNDPAQRAWIDANIPADKLYIAPANVGESMKARGIAEVIASKSDKFKEGDKVQVNTSWQQYIVVDADTAMPLKPLKGGLDVAHYLGALGGTGLTAYYGLVVIAEAKAGDKIVVSGAAGATGSMVVQIASKIVGAENVVGIAGTDEKCRWVEELGATKCLNYKSSSFEQDLIAATKDGVDVYFDNVGGKILDLTLARMNRDGRIAACGAIASYNSRAPNNIQNWFNIITMRLQVRGFIILDFPREKAMEAQGLLIKAIEDGTIKITDENQTVVDTKIEDVPKTWMRLFEGNNQGKLVTKLI